MIDGGERDVDSLAGIESLELLLAIPHSIAATPTEAWVRRDALGWSAGGRREEGGEGLQSRPTSPAPITQAEKTIFFFFRASLLKTERSPGFGHEKRIINRAPFFLFWMVLGSAFPEPKTARKNVSANGNGKGGGEVGVGKWRWMEVSD